MPKAKTGGLARWFKEDWKDTKTGGPCGRKHHKGSKRPYPACRPTHRVSSKTPRRLSEMSKEEKARFKRIKQGPKRVMTKKPERRD